MIILDKRIVLLMILFFVLISTSISPLRFEVAKASGTIYIMADGSVDPPTAPIQHTDNTYTFTNDINEPIVVKRDYIVIDGAGFIVQGTGNGTGIGLLERRNVTIMNAEIKSFQYGIQMNYSSNNSISGNTITDNCYGIELRFCSNTTVSENSVTSYRHDVGYGTTYGILLSETSRTFASENNITRNDIGILILDSSSYNVISENNITNNTEGIVILSGPSDNAIIRNQIAHSFRSIMLNEPGENNVFSKNKITDSDNAVWALKTSNNTFSENYMTNPRGFYFHQCNYNEFYRNEISGDIGIWFTDYSSHNVIYENNINNSHVQLDDSFSNTIYRNNMTKCGVTLVSSSNNSISGNYMNGISLWQSNYNSILGNSVIGNDQYGIRLSESSGNILRDNKMVDNHYNFYIYGETASDFVNDIDTSNTVDGRPIYYWINKRDSTVPSGAGYVTLINCTLITVKNQSLVGNGQGILLINTTDSTLNENNITNNWEGIRLSESSGNSIFENNIKANKYGVGLQDSSNNKFYHNNFINNFEQVFIKNSNVNVWNDGLEGNYWSDYNGTDSDHDGIGDTSYEIDANNTDNYPLMGMFYGFAVMWQEKTYAVNVISNSTVSGIGYVILTSFQWPNHTGTKTSFDSIYFYVSGEDGTYGFCRVCIPVALLNTTYRVFVNGTEVPYSLLPCSNSTDSYLYFTYSHSTERVEITPEFPSFLTLPLFIVATLLAVVIHKESTVDS